MRAITSLFATLALAGPVWAQSQAELGAAKAILAQVQGRSIAENREYCGYLGYTAAGALASTPPQRGQLDSCTLNWPSNLRVIASWHTHAAYDQGARSEVPTVNDVNADRGDGINGYVATPGGRLWFVDTARMTVRQVCGLGCLGSDPRFRRGSEGPIAQTYTYQQLLRREAN